MNAERCLTWLRFLPEPVPEELKTPLQVARFELDQAMKTLAPGMAAKLCPCGEPGDDFEIERREDAFVISGGEPGVLYGAYRLLKALAAGREISGKSAPHCSLRMLNCWDNMSGDIERGYSGRSLWFEGDAFDYDPARIRQLGRMMASVGLNVLCVNNVNVHEPAQRLIEDLLPQLAEFAAILRPFGVRLMVSVDFSRPLRHGISTADPLDPQVQAWWSEQAGIIWKMIPDLAGFLVKADSEHRPGPFSYGRSHADGANMLARAIRPFGGVLVWRCFVYNCMQDWRDSATDRPMAAYQHYAPLDGQFDDNVILQIKHGPFDFQVREPVSPLLMAMRRTRMAVEFQLAQEYTGQQIDLYAMPGMWREVYDDLPDARITAMAAVSNLGRDENYTGHPFAAVNLFCFGLFAWDPDSDPEENVRLWARLSYALPPEQEDTLVSMLCRSRGIYEKYTSPLGLCWMVNPNYHYGPSPDGYEYQAWGTYHRADRNAVGIDRTERGTGYLSQYPEALRARYADPDACPDNLKLFFHRLRYDYVMPDGRTLIQRIYDDHFEGAEETERLSEMLETLALPEPDRGICRERMQRQLENAREWRDVINTFFHRLSGAEDAHGRTIWP